MRCVYSDFSGMLKCLLVNPFTVAFLFLIGSAFALLIYLKACEIVDSIKKKFKK